MKAFLAGLGVGAAVGLLFSPQEGRKNRARLAQYANELFDRLRDQEQGKPPSVGKEVPESEAVAEVLMSPARTN